MQRRAFLLTSAGLAVPLAGCAGGDDDAAGNGQNADLPQEATIAIGDGEFDPRTVEIATGGTVTWENESDQSYRINSFQFHTESEGWSFSETVEAGESMSHTFEEEGLFDFIEPAAGQFAMCGRVRVGNVDEGQSLPCE